MAVFLMVSSFWSNFISCCKIYYVSVRYATGRFQPPIDASSQVTQQMAINSDGMMKMQFMRPIISEDTKVSSNNYNL